MKKNYWCIILFVAFLLSCSYFPIPVHIKVAVVDTDNTAISGISCVLSRNNKELARSSTDSNGACTLITEKGYEDKYEKLELFVSELRITCTDLDGSANGGDFETLV